MRIHLRGIARFAVGVSCMALSLPAYAQQSGGSDADNALGDIVVTAQKREQNLQDVPLAISAISQAKVEQLGIKDSRDMSGLAPNVTVVQGTTSLSAAVISIRGIPTPASETFGLDTANALYIDGVYIGRSGGSGIDVMDIERVEVLRGPQGTLFGRNTTGGALAFISRAPSKEMRAKAEAGFGNYGLLEGKVQLDPGEILGIATSFSYAHRERNGVVDNILEPEKSNDPGARKSDAFRVAAKTDIGTTGSIQYIFDWSRVRGRAHAFQLTNVADGTVRAPIVIDGQSLLMTQQAPVSQYLAASTFLEPGCAALATPRRAYRDTVCNNNDDDAVDKTWGHNLQIQNDFGAFKIKSTTGWRHWNSDSFGSDLDGIGTLRGAAFSNSTLFNGFPAPLLQSLGFPAGTSAFLASSPVPTNTQDLFDTNNKRRHEQFSQEFEISGDTDHLDWVTGGFYFWERGSENNPQNSGFILDTNSLVFSDAGFVGVLRGVGFPAEAAGQFAPLLAPQFRAANPARYRRVQTNAILKYTATNESTAVYAQATYHPGGRDGRLKLTAGGRYSWDSKAMVRTQNGAAALAAAESGSAKFSKFTWNVMAGYELSDTVQGFARVATGYRSGGFNAQDAAIRGTTTLPSFAEESVVSYEAGLKSELFDRRVRLNASVYYNEYSDLAVNIPLTDAPAGTFASRIGNAGKVTYTGFELEGAAILSRHFSIDGNLGYVDIKYKEFMAGQSTTPGRPPINIASVVTPGYTSPFTANIALNAQYPIGTGDARIVARVGYTYEDGKYSFTSLIASPYNEALKGDNRNLIDAQISVDRIKVGGAQAQVKLWVKNLTNSHDFVRGIDFGQLGFGGGYYADPRTFGATFGLTF